MVAALLCWAALPFPRGHTKLVHLGDGLMRWQQICGVYVHASWGRSCTAPRIPGTRLRCCSETAFWMSLRFSPDSARCCTLGTAELAALPPFQGCREGVRYPTRLGFWTPLRCVCVCVWCLCSNGNGLPSVLNHFWLPPHLELLWGSFARFFVQDKVSGKLRKSLPRSSLGVRYQQERGMSELKHLPSN